MWHIKKYDDEDEYKYKSMLEEIKNFLLLFNHF